MKRLLCTIALLACLLTDLRAQRHYVFSKDTLGTEWQYVGERNANCYRIVDGKLRLYGDINELKDTSPTTFVGLPQDEGKFEVNTKLTLTDAENGDEAGVCVYRSKEGYVQCALNNYNGQRRLKLRVQLLSHRILLVDRPVGLMSEVLLRISFNGSKYSFSYSTDGKRYHWLEQVESGLLDKGLVGGEDRPLVGMFCYNANTKYYAGFTFGEFHFFNYDAKE